jgi:hypothetical protein
MKRFVGATTGHKTFRSPESLDNFVAEDNAEEA